MPLTSRQRVRAIFAREGNQSAMWTGHPNTKTIPIYAKEWGIRRSREAIYAYLKDDCRWIRPERDYHHPEKVKLFDAAYKKKRDSLSAEGCFAHAQSMEDIKDYPWPKVEYFDFDSTIKTVERFQGKMVFTGFWCPFYHQMADFFGMEKYFTLMYDNPKLIEAVTEKIVDFYVEANDRYFTLLGDRADVMFMGNDFGTQRDLMISPSAFRRFVLPSFKRLVAVGKKHNKKVLLHSCGSIYRIIPDLIEAGVDALHPIQAQAAGMSALELAQYKNDLSFVGGIDAQSFFVTATPQQVKDEVHRVRDILGGNIVISPSHEEILPNVPAANVYAMMEAARD